MFPVDIEWIRLGLFFVCFASFTESRIDYNNAGGSNFFSENTVEGAQVPASTFLLDWNALKSSSVTRNQLFRMQRQAYMSSPITRQHYHGAATNEFQHQFSLFNPFTTTPQEAQPQNIEATVNLIPAKSLESEPSSSFVGTTPKTKVYKIKKKPLGSFSESQKKRKYDALVKSPEKLPRKIGPFFPSIPTTKSERNLEPTHHSPLQQRKRVVFKSSRSNDINHNFLSKFKVYDAVPAEKF